MRYSVHPEFVKYLDRNIRMHRDDAAAIIEYTGANSLSGNYAQDIPPYLLGRAIGQLVYNYFTKVENDDDHAVLEQDEGTITREFLLGLLG